MDWQSKLNHFKQYGNGQNSAPQNNQFGNGYLSAGNFDTQNDPNISWEDFVRQLSFSQLDNVTNMNSPLYQQYTKMLQKTTPGMGLNTLLGMAMSSGTGYAGGQGIAQQKAMQFNKQRNDSINNGVGSFATNMQGQVQGLLGQIGGSFASTMDRKLAQEQADAASSPWGMIGQGLGGILGIATGGLLAPKTPNSMAGAGGSGTAGYKPNATANPYQQTFNNYPATWGFGY